MKKKTVSMLVSFLLITVLIAPISSLAIEISETLGIDQPDDIIDPPLPGMMTSPLQELNIPDDLKYDSKHHNILTNSRDENVEALIQQLDEVLYLGFWEEIVAFGPRVTETPECHAAGDYLFSEFQSMGLDVRFHNWSHGGYTDRNVEGTLQGVDNTSDEIYIICAHFDTVAGSPGADDDGSGVANFLSAAYLMSQYEFNHTVRFVGFSGEEEGLHGSHVYAQEAFDNGDNIVAVLNVDMISYAVQNGDRVKVFDNEESQWLTDFTIDVAQTYDEYIGLNIIDSGWSGSSDHYYFWEYGYDAIFYHNYDQNPYYHSPQDIIDNMNLSYATKCSRLSLATLAELAQPVGTFDLPPAPPNVEGPTEGVAGEEYEFTFVTSDPEGYDVFYYIDWGDDSYEEWIGPFSSGQEVSVNHTWEEQDIFTIRAKAKDENETQGGWSDPLDITIIAVEIVDIKGGLGVNVDIENIAEIDVTDINWSISVNGGFFGKVNKTSSDTISEILAGDTTRVRSGVLFGIGPLEITVTVDFLTTDAAGFILGPFVLVL